MNQGVDCDHNLRNGVKEDDRKWVVTLNRYEIDMVEHVTKDKLRLEDVAQIQNRTTDFYRRLNAYGAELAFCKLFNLYRDFDIHYGSYDVVITFHYENYEERKTVDVKQTIYNNGKVWASKNSTPCDIYALMVGEIPTFIYRGAIPGEILFRPENLETMGSHEVYAASQGRLSMELFF
jgi:hypothetical protein